MADLLCVLIYETSETTRKKLHDVLVGFAVSRNTEVRIDWIRPNATETEIAAACADEHVAFVNAVQAERATEIGRCIYEQNPECALVYYGAPETDDAERLIAYFRKLFPSRPVAYCREPDAKTLFQTVCRLSEQKVGRNVFVWENKGMKFRIPYGSILYFRSDRNYVFIRLKNGEEYSFLGKLTDVLKTLNEHCFVRVHQSYLINKSAIILIDKGKKCVRLAKVYIPDPEKHAVYEKAYEVWVDAYMCVNGTFYR